MSHNWTLNKLTLTFGGPPCTLYVFKSPNLPTKKTTVHSIQNKLNINKIKPKDLCIRPKVDRKITNYCRSIDYRMELKYNVNNRGIS